MGKRKVTNETRFPNETARYRTARNRLLDAEVALRRQTEAVAAQRRRLPLGGQVTEDYTFKAWSPDDGKPGSLRFSQLFRPGKDTLFLYNFMFPESPDSDTPCPSCTSIIDAVDGSARHLVHRINFAVIAEAPITKFRDHARRRGWRHATLLSSAGTSFKRDFRAATDEGQQLPLAQVFVRRDGKFHHFWTSELWWAKAERSQDLRHVDFMWPVWSILDCTPEGRGTDFYPQLEYQDV